jgi:abortive infection bacteriophage resistance protein
VSPSPFIKPPSSISRQLVILKSRGLDIQDHAQAEEFLTRVSYYRLSGYTRPYMLFSEGKCLDKFIPGTTFNDVETLYRFDLELRHLLLKYIEPIEIAFRTAICHEIALITQNAFWYLEEQWFSDPAWHQDFLKLCYDAYRRSEEEFIHAYADKHSDPANPTLPPCWMQVEIMSFGVWSKVYKHINDQGMRRAIAQRFCTSAWYLESWIHSIVVTRNLCAHHSRIWNRILPVRPRVSQRMRLGISATARIGAVIAAMYEILHALGQASVLIFELDELLNNYPRVQRAKMGLL